VALKIGHTIVRIATATLLAVVLVGILVVSVVVAMKLVTVDVSWTEKIPPGQQEQPRRTLGPGDRVEEVHPVVQTYYEEAVGTLKAATRTEIAARVLAPIQRITVRAGDRVEKGAVLIILDDRTFKTTLSKAESDRLSAQASRLKAENNYRRTAALVLSLIHI